MQNLIATLKCRIGLHTYQYNAQAASLDTFWLGCGEFCNRCGHVKIAKGELRSALMYAYSRGKERGQSKCSTLI